MFTLAAAAGGILIGGAGLVTALYDGHKGVKIPAVALGANGAAIGIAIVLHLIFVSPASTRAQPGEAPLAAPAAAGGKQFPPLPVATEPSQTTPEDLAAEHREGLKSSEVTTRRLAAAALRDLGAAAAPAVAELADALRDSDPEVRGDAAEALANLGQQAGPAYVNVLRATADSDGRVRQMAERFLGTFGPPPDDAVSVLIGLTADENVPPQTRARALGALAKSKTAASGVVPAYLASLKSPDEPVRIQALRCLGASVKVRDRDVLPKLLDALNDPSKSVRDAAAESLDRAGSFDQTHVPALLDALKSDSPEVRTTVLRYLGNIGKEGRSASTEVAAALRDRDPSVRLGAVECLTRIAPDQTDAVAALLADRDKDVRKTVATKLRGILTPAQCFEALTDALAAPDAASRKDAAEALDLLDLPADITVPTRTKVRLSTALSDESALVRLKAAKALQRLGWASEDATPVLAKLLAQDGEGVSREAAETLNRIGATATRKAADELVRALSSKDAGTRRAAAAALRSAGPLKATAVPELIEALADSAMHENVSALLADFGEGAVAELMTALGSKSAATRKGAAKALGLVGPKAMEAYRPLTACFKKDPDSEVRQEAGKAMDLIRRKP
jgi:HEAT repeat protein